MKKRIFGALLTATMVISSLVSCGGQATTTAAGTVADSATTAAVAEAGKKDIKDIVIGVSMKDNSDTFVKNISDAIDAKAKEIGVKINMTDAQGDVNKQISDIENFITQKVDCIILNPQDMEGSAPCVALAKDAGIPLIVCNADVSNKEYTGFVGCTDQESGEMLGKWFIDNVPEGSKICIIEGPMGQAGQVGRMEGFKAVGMLDYFEVLSTQTANWKRDEAMALTEDWLTTYGNDLKAIVCENDDMALGALSACKAAGRTDVVIGGVDGLEDALQAVKNGEMGVSIIQDSAGQGSKSVELAVQVAQGEEIPYDTRIPFQEATKENVDQFIG